jgi:hypothetical protein
LTRTGTIRVVGLVALGSVVTLGGIAALGMPSFGAGPDTRSGGLSDVTNASTTNEAVATSVTFAVDLYAHVPVRRTAHLQVEGQMDFVDHTMTATVTVPSEVLHATSSNAEIAAVGKPKKLHTQWVGRHAYLTVPSSWAALAGGAQTLALPTSPALQRMVTTALTQSAVALTYAKILLDELTDHHTAHRLGARTIDGVTATGRQVQLTLAQLLKLVPQLTPTMTKNIASMSNVNIPATVWVDRQGRLVEAKLAAAKGSGASVTGTVKFSHYGAPVKAIVPPASPVKRIPPGLEQLLGDLYYF